jgi:hypothetical protein
VTSYYYDTISLKWTPSLCSDNLPRSYTTVRSCVRTNDGEHSFR